MRHWMIGLAALMAAIPASAQVTLTPGQSVAVKFDVEGNATPGKPQAAQPGAHDLEARDELRGTYAASPPKPGEIAPAVPMGAGKAPTPAVIPDQVTALFFTSGEDSVLALQNGYGRGVMYRARITFRGRTEPTDVCLVLPGKRGYEHWPFAIEKIELSAFTFEDWTPGTPLPCR